MRSGTPLTTPIFGPGPARAANHQAGDEGRQRQVKGTQTAAREPLSRPNALLGRTPDLGGDLRVVDSSTARRWLPPSQRPVPQDEDHPRHDQSRQRDDPTRLPRGQYLDQRGIDADEESHKRDENDQGRDAEQHQTDNHIAQIRT